MTLFYKISILIVVVVAAWILVGLLQERQYWMITLEEGLANLSESSKTGLPLKQLCVKSSYNSAYYKKKITTEQLVAVLKLGYRFVDFEIYADDKGGVFVGAINSSDRVRLTDMLDAVVQNAFSAPSPNPSDPLFIQLRIMDTTVMSVYNNVGMALANTVGARLYKDSSGNVVPVTGNTLFSDVAGKVVVVCDKTINSSYQDLSNYPNCSSALDDTSCYALSKYVHVESGTTTLRTSTYTGVKSQHMDPITLDPADSLRTEVKYWRLVVPDGEGTANPDPTYYFSNYSTQFLAVSVPIGSKKPLVYTDNAWDQYEAVFKNYGAAFVPLSQIRRFYVGGRTTT